MIEKILGYKVKTKDGEQFCPTILDAQRASIVNLHDRGEKDKTSASGQNVANWILENKEAILDILTTTDRSKPALRKINGAKRKPRAATAAQNASIQDGKQ